MRRILAVTLAVVTAATSVAAAVGSAQAAPLAPRSIPTAEGRQLVLEPVQYGQNRDNNGGYNRGRGPASGPGASQGANRGRGPGPGPGASQGANRGRDAFRARSYWDSRNGSGYYTRTYGDTRRDNSSAIAAGFLGFILGAAISGTGSDRTYATSRLGNQTYISSCASRYRSFDPRSGTYLGYDGYRHYCR